MRTMEESIEQKAQERADRKLQYIIGRYGDANGERRKTWTDAASQKGAFENYDNAKACEA